MVPLSAAGVAPGSGHPALRSRHPRWSGIGRPIASPFRNGDAISAQSVKARARELGVDLVGIASARVLNAFPPDPRWPQTPERISPHVKSVIVIVQRIPAGAFRCRTNTPVQYMDMLVLRKMDKVAYRLAEELERAGHPSFVVPAQETEWNLKRASYGRLSTRHLGRRSRPRHARARGQHPHTRVRAARLSHRHPHGSLNSTPTLR